jgi:site-specific recombinase XerC
MTRRERLEMVIAQNITAELIEECKAELEKMDTANAKRREKEDPRKTENAEIMEKIVSVLKESTEPMQIDPIVEALGIEGLTRQRVSSLCTLLVKDERITSEDVKVKGKGKRKAYSIA